MREVRVGIFTKQLGSTDALRTGVVEGSMVAYEALQGWKWSKVVGAPALH